LTLPGATICYPENKTSIPIKSISSLDTGLVEHSHRQHISRMEEQDNNNKQTRGENQDSTFSSKPHHPSSLQAPPQEEQNSNPPKPEKESAPNENDDDVTVAKCLNQLDKRERAILWRDFTFLILGGLALRIVGYVETHAAESERTPFSQPSTTTSNQDIGLSIIDAGFVLTTPLYNFLVTHREWNDVLALLNSLILIPPLVYVAYATLWKGDFALSFRLLATQLFRSFCGWFTYLPPDPTFLMSVYDFPEVVQCMVSPQSCENSSYLMGTAQPILPQQTNDEPLPFVSFFSGHVASTVIIANHMYINGHRKCGVLLHAFNVFQILRLLATRGHYSIDIIIGWVVAIYVSNPAERLGEYYTKGKLKRKLMPENAMEAFETVIGVYDYKRMTMRKTLSERGMVRFTSMQNVTSSFRGKSEMEEEYACDTTAAKLVANMASKWAHKNLQDLQKELTQHGLQIAEIRELRRNDLIRLLTWASLKMDEMRDEARKMDLKLMDSMPKSELLAIMWERTKILMEQHSGGGVNEEKTVTKEIDITMTNGGRGDGGSEVNSSVNGGKQE